MRYTVTGRARMWLAVAQILILLSLFTSPAFASPEPPPLTGLQLIQLLQHYGIVKGDDQGNLNLERPITRAEMFTILVRSMGKESEAQLYKGLVTFTDAQGHWAESNIAYAFFNGLIKGDGDGRVRPDDPVTYGEVFTLLVRLVATEPTTGEWPFNVFLEAAQLKVIPVGINAGNLREPAVRALVFQALASSISTVPDTDGKTVLQKYVDTKPPVVKVNAITSPTLETKVKVSGTAEDAVAVYVNDLAVTLVGTSFSTDVALEYGDNPIKVVAFDRAGNSATTAVSVVRTPPISSIEITGPARVRPGATETYTVLAKDLAGKAAPLTGITATVEGGIGTFDLATGKFVAGNKQGKGKITLKVGNLTSSANVEVMGIDPAGAQLFIPTVNNGLAVAYTKPMTVQVQVLDVNGKLLETDYGRTVSLSATGLPGLGVTPATAQTEAGVATFTVTSTLVGYVSLDATSSGLTDGSRVAQFGTNLRLKLTADPSTLTVGGSASSSTIRARLVDENGATIANPLNEDIFVRVVAPANAGVLNTDTLVIPRGASLSENAALYSPGFSGGSVTFSGNTISTTFITVDPISVTVIVPTVGASTSWDLLGGTSHTPGVPATLALRIMDGQGSTISGTYAFQLRVETSNNESKTNGIPSGVSITLGDTGLTPISDGVAEGAVGDSNDVIARTINGVSSLRVTYDKPGQVYVTVLPLAATANAYASDGTVGSAAGTSGIPEKTFTLTYSGTAVGVQLRVDSQLGQNLTVGAASTTGSKTYTLRATLVDGSGYWVPSASSTITLARVSGSSTTLPGTLSAATVNGKATFTINTTSNTGDDIYKVTAVLGSTVDSNSVTLQTQSSLPPAPSILATRGIMNTIPGTPDYVSPDDTGLEIELAQAAGQKWTTVKVYRENSGTPIYTSAPIYMPGSAPRVVVPKSAIPSGNSRYQVSLVNGHGEGPKSALTNTITNSVYVTNITLSSARYQRSTKQMTLYGSGFFYSTDLVNPASITVHDASTGVSRSLAGAGVTINNSGQITLNLSSLSSLTADLANPALFSGQDVTVRTLAGWYVRGAGEQAMANSSGVQLTPMAHITHSVFDRVNRRLTLHGRGFTTGTADFSKVRLQVGGSSDIVLSSFSSSLEGDTKWVINLSQAAVDALVANGGYVLNALDNWFYQSSWTQGAISNIPIYTQVALSNVTYNDSTHKVTLKGSGFTGGTVALNKLRIVDLSTAQTVTLTGTYSITADDQIEFTLDSTAYTAFEDPAKFQGSDIYLVGDSGWFTDSLSRQSAEIPERTLRFPDR